MTGNPDADAIALRSLTDRQRRCLRHVGLGRRSKQIARELGLSSHTIDKDIERASRVLGCNDRFSAAEKLRALEQPGYEPFVYEPAPIADHCDSPPRTEPQPSASPGSETNGSRLREARVPFDHGGGELGELEARWREIGPFKQSLTILLAVVILSLLVGGTVAAWLGIDWLFHQHGIR